MLRDFFLSCTGTGNERGVLSPCREEGWDGDAEKKIGTEGQTGADRQPTRIDELDLSGVVELKRNANGTFEARFVDKVRVLAMLRELMEERRDGELEGLLDGLCRGSDGGEG